MSGPELAEWIAFSNLYDLPDGFFVAATMARLWGSKDTKVSDLVPFYAAGRRVQSAAEQQAIMAAYRGG